MKLNGQNTNDEFEDILLFQMVESRKNKTLTTLYLLPHNSLHNKSCVGGRAKGGGLRLPFIFKG